MGKKWVKVSLNRVRSVESRVNNYPCRDLLNATDGGKTNWRDGLKGDWLLQDQITSPRLCAPDCKNIPVGIQHEGVGY